MPGGCTADSGFGDAIRDYQFAGDPRPFAVLGRALAAIGAVVSGVDLAR